MRINVSLLILAFTLMNQVQNSSFCLRKATINQLNNILMISFDSAFETHPDFAYAIQSLHLKQNEASIPYSVITSSQAYFKIQFNITITGIYLQPNDQVNLVFMFTTYSRVQFNVLSIENTTYVVLYKNKHKLNSQYSYSLTVYTLTVPLIWNIISKASQNFTISFVSASTLPIIFSYVLVQKIFIASQTFILFDLITEISADYILNIDSQNLLAPSNENSFLGLMQLNYTGSDIVMNIYNLYSYFDPYNSLPSVKVAYLLGSSNIISFQGAFMNFNPDFVGCPSSNQFLAYKNPYTIIPDSCQNCDNTCLTCTSSEYDSNFTNADYCLTCPIGRYLQPLTNADYGNCMCLKGTEVDANGNCKGCSFACLGYTVTFMESSTIPSFLIIFSEAYIDMLIDLEDNLVVTIGNNVSKFTQKNVAPGAYQIILPSESLAPCQKTCNVNFKFKSPQYIKYKNKYLTKQEENLIISDFYIVQKRIPKQLNQAFQVVTLIIAVSSSTGQTSLIKMLFQLEQIIDIHKYLQLEIPVVFKEFIESLMYFRFLDFTTVMKFDVQSAIAQFCPNDLDNKGPPKVVYYENGANFYKNMTQVLISVFLILIINFLICLITRLLPFEITKKLSDKLKVRLIITISDMVQTIAIPTGLFAMCQFSYMTWEIKYIWTYILAFIFSSALFLFPFVIVIYVAQKMRKATELQIQIYGDLLQDCKIKGRITYIFYVYNFIKKFMLGFFLAINIPGLIQVFVLIVANSIHLAMIGYIIAHNIFNGRIKIITRLLNLISVIVIQGLILGYNVNYNTIQQMILIGITCTYLAIVITGVSMVQVFIKFFEILTQKTQDDTKIDKDPNQIHSYVKDYNDKAIKCNIDKKIAVFNFEENDDDENLSQEEYIENYYELETNPQTRTIKFEETTNSKQTKDFIRPTFSQTRSDNSEIVSIDSTDILRETSSKDTFRDTGYYRRQNTLRRKNKRNIQEIQQEYDENQDEDIRETKKYSPNKNIQQDNQKKTIQMTLQTAKRQNGNQYYNRIKKTKKTIDEPSNTRDRLVMNMLANHPSFKNGETQSSLSEIISIQEQK